MGINDATSTTGIIILNDPPTPNDGSLGLPGEGGQVSTVTQVTQSARENLEGIFKHSIWAKDLSSHQFFVYDPNMRIGSKPAIATRWNGDIVVGQVGDLSNPELKAVLDTADAVGGYVCFAIPKSKLLTSDLHVERGVSLSSAGTSDPSISLKFPGIGLQIGAMTALYQQDRLRHGELTKARTTAVFDLLPPMIPTNQAQVVKSGPKAVAMHSVINSRGRPSISSSVTARYVSAKLSATTGAYERAAIWPAQTVATHTTPSHPNTPNTQSPWDSVPLLGMAIGNLWRRLRPGTSPASASATAPAVPTGPVDHGATTLGVGIEARAAVQAAARLQPPALSLPAATPAARPEIQFMPSGEVRVKSPTLPGAYQFFVNNGNGGKNRVDGEVIYLNDPRVSGQHCQVTVNTADRTITVNNLSKNTVVVVNGQTVKMDKDGEQTFGIGGQSQCLLVLGQTRVLVSIPNATQHTPLPLPVPAVQHTPPRAVTPPPFPAVGSFDQATTFDRFKRVALAAQMDPNRSLFGMLMEPKIEVTPQVVTIQYNSGPNRSITLKMPPDISEGSATALISEVLSRVNLRPTKTGHPYPLHIFIEWVEPTRFEQALSVLPLDEQARHLATTGGLIASTGKTANALQFNSRGIASSVSPADVTNKNPVSVSIQLPASLMLSSHIAGRARPYLESDLLLGGTSEKLPPLEVRSLTVALDRAREALTLDGLAPQDQKAIRSPIRPSAIPARSH